MKVERVPTVTMMQQLICHFTSHVPVDGCDEDEGPGRKSGIGRRVDHCALSVLGYLISEMRDIRGEWQRQSLSRRSASKELE